MKSFKFGESRFFVNDKDILLNYTDKGIHIASFITENYIDHSDELSGIKIKFDDYKFSLFEFILANQNTLSSGDLANYMSAYNQVSSAKVTDLASEFGTYKDFFKPDEKFIGNLHVSYNLSGSKKAVILMDGLPNQSSRHDLLANFCALGFDSFYPKHSATWESKGEFSLEELRNSYSYLIDNLTDEYKEVYLIANSFGGTVASVLPNLKKLKKIILLCPALNLVIVDKIETLHKYLQSRYGDAFRINDIEWEKFVSNFSEVNTDKFKDVKNKSLFIFGSKDKSIPLDKYKKIFDEEFNTVIWNKEHMGMSRLYLAEYLFINKFFSE